MRLDLLVEQCLAPVPGGTGRYTRELGEALARVAGPGGGVRGWCAWHRDLGPARLAGVAGPVRLKLPRRALAVAWERGQGPRPRGADAVVAPTVLCPPRGQAALLVVVHDAVPWTHPETLTARGVAFHRRMVARVARGADVICVPTAAVGQELARNVSGWPTERVHVVGAGVSAAVRHLPVDAEARARRLGLPAEGFLLVVATREPRKGLDVALAALADPALAGGPVLCIAGAAGWGRVDPLAQAAALGLPPGRVRLLGPLGDADLAVALSRALVLLAPSRAEGFGLPVLEAMAHAVPVVSSDVPALAEVAGGATLLVPVGDASALAQAVARVLADSALAARLGQLGRVRASGFTWERTARTIWTLLGDGAGGGRPPGAPETRGSSPASGGPAA